MEKKRLDFIQVLRGLAALIVVMGHHAWLVPDGYRGPIFKSFAQNAIFGVEIFFIISGFIIVHSTQKKAKEEGALTFLIKRIIRIYPIYFIVFTYWIIFCAFDNNIRNTEGIYSTASIIKSYLFIFLDPSASSPYYGWGTLVVTWSLIYEFYFYLCFALAMAINHKYRAYIAIFLLTAFSLAVATFTGNSLTNAMSFSFHSDLYVNYLLTIGNPIIYDFVFGMTIAILYANGFFHKISNKFTTNIALIILTFSVLLAFKGYRIGLGLHYASPIALSIILCAFICDEYFKPNYSKFLIALGGASYSLYLIHIPIQKTLVIYGKDTGFIPQGGDILLPIFSFILSIVASFVVFKLVEDPINKWGHKLAYKFNRK